jgi:hypothetical protein
LLKKADKGIQDQKIEEKLSDQQSQDACDLGVPVDNVELRPNRYHNPCYGYVRVKQDCFYQIDGKKVSKEVY